MLVCILRRLRIAIGPCFPSAGHAPLARDLFGALVTDPEAAALLGTYQLCAYFRVEPLKVRWPTGLRGARLNVQLRCVNGLPQCVTQHCVRVAAQLKAEVAKMMWQASKTANIQSAPRRSHSTCGDCNLFVIITCHEAHGISIGGMPMMFIRGAQCWQGMIPHW